MEDLWKVAHLDYRIAAIGEVRAYEAMIDRYHAEETGEITGSRQESTDPLPLPVKE